VTTVIVICAGEAQRWGDYLNTPKHLIAPEGERLIDRTTRLFRAAGAERVYVVSKPGDMRYETPYGERVDAKLNPRNGDADKFLSSRHLWSTTGRTVVVYGDVWFDPEAVEKIMADRDDWTLYCRPGPSQVTGATSGECFAVGFHPRHHAEYAAALNRVAALWRDGKLKRCGGWETYRAMCGAENLRKHRMYNRFVEIGGWVEDFDKPADYDKWIERRRRLVASPSVSVLIPYRPDGGHRDQALEWVQRRWAIRHPSWQIIIGEHPADGPWVKARAVADALTRADGEILVVADADVWTDGVALAVDAVHKGAPWAVPHSKVHRLGEKATTRVLAGEEPSTAMGGLARKPYLGVEGGGVVVLPRSTYEKVPLDPRYAGWGQEDESWGLALSTVVGRRWRGTALLWHLWHEPQPRLNSHVGSAESRALHVRYQVAAKEGRKSMRALLAEIPGYVPAAFSAASSESGVDRARHPQGGCQPPDADCLNESGVNGGERCGRW
jgi:Predicted sugar nucleotidyltransferases